MYVFFELMPVFVLIWQVFLTTVFCVILFFILIKLLAFFFGK